MQSSWKVIGAFLGVFVAGSVFGGFFALRIGQELEERGDRRGAPGRGPAPLAVQMLQRFGEQLDLTDQQREKIRPKVLKAEEQLSRLRQANLEETNDILRRLQADFRAELTIEQRGKLDRLEINQNEIVGKGRGGLRQEMGAQPFGPGNRPFPNGARPPGGPRAPGGAGGNVTAEPAPGGGEVAPAAQPRGSGQ